jgi:hypothetical protein
VTITYDTPPRHLEAVTIENSDVASDRSYVTLTWSNGWSFGGCPVEHASALTVGTEAEVETVRFSTVTGIRVAGRWLYRKSDQDLMAEHEAMVDRNNRDRQAQLDRNREVWQARQDALPSWLRTRLEYFHERGGEHFRRDGWGYELVVCELAALYAASPDATETREIDEYALLNGTSGNQHDCAQALAQRFYRTGVAVEFPAALTPITGDPDYSKGKQA